MDKHEKEKMINRMFLRRRTKERRNEPALWLLRSRRIKERRGRENIEHTSADNVLASR
jgi:hypothetical protein